MRPHCGANDEAIVEAGFRQLAYGSSVGVPVRPAVICQFAVLQCRYVSARRLRGILTSLEFKNSMTVFWMPSTALNFELSSNRVS